MQPPKRPIHYHGVDNILNPKELQAYWSEVKHTSIIGPITDIVRFIIVILKNKIDTSYDFDGLFN